MQCLAEEIAGRVALAIDDAQLNARYEEKLMTSAGDLWYERQCGGCL